jgi:hypothetical protein
MSNVDPLRLVLIAAALGSVLSAAAMAQEQPSSSQQPQQPQPPPQQPAPPQQPNADPATAMLGAWEFSNADHDKICRFVFRSDAVTGGSRVDVDKNCANLFPSTKDIVGWSVDNFGSLRLLDGRGAAVIELTEAESGLYDGFQPGEGRYILQSAAAAPVRSAEDIVGDWGVARGTGKAICVLSLINAPAGGDALTLNIKPGCDPLVTRFNPTGWRMDQGELLLLSARGQKWRFEENDVNTWQRVPESTDPVLLVRQ